MKIYRSVILLLWHADDDERKKIKIIIIIIITSYNLVRLTVYANYYEYTCFNYSRALYYLLYHQHRKSLYVRSPAILN